MLSPMPENNFDEWIAGRYARLWPELHEPAAIEPVVDFLARLAGDRPALEFGIGTGRIGVPLSRRGIHVHGIELSEAMAGRIRQQPGGDAVGVTIGDFATADTGETYALVYLLRNTITNLTTQEEQVEAFRNAARHLEPGGHFVIENYIPALQQIPPGQTRRVFTATPDHVGFEEYDIAAQIAWSHHYWVIDGELKSFSTPHRYVWASELDLMARIAGLTLTERWSSWLREPFTSASTEHISVWQKDR